MWLRIPSTSSASSATPWTAAGDESSSVSTATAVAPATPSTPPAAPCTPARTCTGRQQQRLTALFAVEEHAEVEATWASTSG